MDILFSPHLPSSAMAEVEIKTQALRTTSFQRMLELEKKYKMERLQNSPTPPASPPPPSDSAFQDRPPLQIRRADSLSRQQNYLMLKAARRSTAPPPLSITIPESANGGGRDLAGQASDPDQEDDEDTETEATAEPLHKQVKFLAPDKEDDDMSDQSSICQSPSWEGYGQRKKEKKKEAERRKKEKEQADKEAKAAKKRLAARLSKAPPPSTMARNSSLIGITNAERSMSDPLLTAPHLSVESRLAHPPQNVERAASTNDLQHVRAQKRSEAEVADPGANSRSFVGGVKLEREKGAMVQNALQPMYPPSIPYQLIQTSGPEPRRVGSLSPSFPAVKHESRSPRENAFPPSASRTPMLRHMSGSTHSRSNSLLQGATKFLRGQDGKSHGDSEVSSPTADHSEGSSQMAQGGERGRDRGSGSQQRAQSTSRADGQNPVNGSAHSSSTRSSSRNTQHTRRSSITQEAKSMAMKLTGIKLTPSAKDESVRHGTKDNSQVDYFNFMERSYSTSVLTAMVSGGAPPPTRPTTRGSVRHVAQGEHSDGTTTTRGSKAQRDEPLATSQNSASKAPSIADSVPSTQGKKGRSLKDAARAALHMSSKGSNTPANTSKPLAAAPPYLAFRTRMQSQASNAAEGKIMSSQPEQTLAPAPVPHSSMPPQEYTNSSDSRQSGSGQPSSSNSVKTTELDAQTGSRVSEGSSTSSAYEDGSPLPSPNTTPDTSRPQSSKDLPLHSDDMTLVKGSLVVQDDERTLRQSSDGSRSSNTSTTPRLEDSDERKSLEMTDEDRWSRTALPLDIDCDAQSFTTSFSNLDNQDNVEEGVKQGASLPGREETRFGRKEATQSHTEIWNALKFAMSQPKLAKSLSDPALRPGDADHIVRGGLLPPIEQTIAIPAKSKRREQGTVVSPSEPPREAQPVQQEVKQTPDDVQHSQEARQEEHKDRRSDGVDQGVVNQQVKDEAGSKEPTYPRSSQEADMASTETTLKRESKREKAKRRHPERGSKLQAYDERVELEPNPGAPDRQDITPIRSSTSTPTPSSSLNRTSTSSSLASSTSTKPSLKSPRNGSFPPSNPQDDHPDSSKAKSSPSTSRVSTPDLPRISSAPTPTSDPFPIAPLGPSASRPAGPISILKQPTRSSSDPAHTTTTPSSSRHVLSALPKHMQLQAGISSRPPASGGGESRGMTPIAKMFVECCSCKFYHDMPSKLYECMAKPDAVVEDRMLGISGAITTMVKCPWCAHNMSTGCCAGYAAVVYLKERLH